jgi:hypothetical protein
VGAQATTANIWRALEKLAEDVQKEATVFIYFSGHGGRAWVDHQWQTFLCTCETDPDDLASTAISGEDFSSFIHAVPARKVVVFIDACHAGGAVMLKSIGSSGKWKQGLSHQYLEMLSEGSGRVVIASSKANQVSHVRSQGDLSVFTWYLLQGLRGKAATDGDQIVRVFNLFTYVSQAVRSDCPSQEPVLHAKEVDDNFPISAILIDSEDRTKSLTRTSIRELLITDPLKGANALRHHLHIVSASSDLRNRVDLACGRLERTYQDIQLFGETSATSSEINKVLYLLLGICSQLEL